MLAVEHTAPGGWLAAVIPGRLAVVHVPAPDAAFAARLWAALCDDDGIRLVIDELARHGLTSAPGFVLAEWDAKDDAYVGRFIVRGEAGVAIDTVAGADDITARGVSTWVERPMSGVRGFRVKCIPSDAVGGPALPLVVGTAWVSAVAFGSLAFDGQSTGFAGVPDGIPASEWAPSAAPIRSAPSDATPVVPLASGILAPAPAASAPAAPTGSWGDTIAPSPGDETETPAALLSRTDEGSDVSSPDVVAADAASDAGAEQRSTTDLDRTIADLEATVTGGDAVEADRPAASERPNETTGYDHLFGATLMRGVNDAAVRPESEEGDEAGGAAPSVSAMIAPAPIGSASSSTLSESAPAPLGDHDGLTVMSGDIAALRSAAGAASAPEPAPVVSPAPTAEGGFTLRLPDGSSEPIDGMVVVGRAPSVSKMGGGKVPRLVTVDSVEHDISRNHVQLTIEGGTVVVTDLHSRNGTLIALPGKTPQKLRAGEPTSVIAGTTIDLGSGVTLDVVQA
ncbi:FHA domain-containing protein [Planctomonas sp. JC2975]|uniref:FHA domain-containing protein n=1 Tax=Planctomonas sp. JC2975 TaxID=2729626 RepID=UPI0014730478|nr:FHA domain-containing protein [Planctomonas sp. JC2975]